MTNDPQSIRSQVIVAVTAGLILTVLAFAGGRLLTTFKGGPSQAAVPAMSAAGSRFSSPGATPAPIVAGGAASSGSTTAGVSASAPSTGGTSSAGTSTVHTYRQVTLTLLCSYCHGDQIVGSKVLHYTDAAVAGISPTYLTMPALDGNGTSCRSLRIAFSGNLIAQQKSATVYLEVIQQTAKVVRSFAKAGTITTMSVHPDGGPVEIGASVRGGKLADDAEVNMYITGSCYTPDGRP